MICDWCGFDKPNTFEVESRHDSVGYRDTRVICDECLDRQDVSAYIGLKTVLADMIQDLEQL